MYLSVPAGRQAGRQAGLELLYCILRLRPSSWVHWSQSLSGHEPRKRQSERERRSGEPRAWRAVSLHWGGKSGALAPNSAHAPTVREDPKPQLKTSVTQLRWLLPQLLIWAEATCHGVVCLRRSLCVCVCVCVWLVTWGVCISLKGLKIAASFL